MPAIYLDKLKEIQHGVDTIRNVCILAHVDHGKTTLADSLIASNGIISQKLAGKLRYMDSRTDEQIRGITMKSSSIALYYKGYIYQNEYIINLIDSPGHVDFSSEVSTAVRLCDGAIVIVDVVEGVCAQTRVCLQQAYTERLRPILVLNKIDRLILEKKMTPLDAYYHIVQLLEQVNAVMGNIFAQDVFANEVKTSNDDYTSALEDSDDSNLYFNPKKLNVIFASAIDGWAFVLLDFAKMYSSKLGMTVQQLGKSLWGDFYYNSKEKIYKKGAQEKGKKPMFVQFILENIWNLYETIVVRKDKSKIPDIASKIGVTLTARDLRHTDGRVQLQAIFSQWLPINRAVLEMVLHFVKFPIVTEEKAKRLMCSLNQNFEEFPETTKDLVKDFVSNSKDSENVICFVSKMFAVNRDSLPENKTRGVTHRDLEELRKKISKMKSNDPELKDEIDQKTNDDEVTETTEDDGDQEIFIAFARVYSGTLKKGSKLYVLGPKHDPRLVDSSDPFKSPYISEVVIENLYILMGRELEMVDEMPAGNIVGISGLQNHILKTGTISNNIYCPPFTDLTITATPILRVAVEPKNPLDMPKLLKGLKLLNQADACVQVLIQETGEHILVTLGEVHLERCVKDLEESFAKIELNISEPIVPFRETIVPKATVDMVNEAVEVTNDLMKKIITVVTPNKHSRIKILAVPLPENVTELLDNNVEILKALSIVDKRKLLPDHIIKSIEQLKNNLNEIIKETDSDVFPKNFVEKIWSVGPKYCGPNVLLNLTENYVHSDFWEISNKETFEFVNIENDKRREHDSSFINGFQLATLAGPLCEEPLRGVCFIIYEWTYENLADNSQSALYGPCSGQIMSVVKDGCRKAFQNQPQRLVTPMYSCNIIVRSEALGSMYAFISRRHGRILSNDMIEGSGTFSVTAVIPVIESYNFAQSFRTITSGLAYPQLVFGHWEVVDIDPFWVPSTEEEYMHFGEKADTVNRAKVYMDSVRKRKGLSIQEKLVKHAEKQRTLGKNK